MNEMLSLGGLTRMTRTLLTSNRIKCRSSASRLLVPGMGRVEDENEPQLAGFEGRDEHGVGDVGHLSRTIQMRLETSRSILTESKTRINRREGGQTHRRVDQTRMDVDHLHTPSLVLQAQAKEELVGSCLLLTPRQTRRCW